MCKDTEGAKVRNMVIPLTVLVQTEKKARICLKALYSCQVTGIPAPLRETYV